MVRSAIVEIHKEELKFSSGHFMLLSATTRETMHGHDYQLAVAFHALIQENGMAFDCREYKEKLAAICATLDYRFIIPEQSAYMQIEKTANQLICHFNQQVITFLKQDAVLLPICNVTLEELSYWFLQQLTNDPARLQQHFIQGITVKIFNGRGESGATSWGKI